LPIAAVAAGAFAATEIATVGIAAMSAFEVIAAVGAITSGIGALTGNEDLMKIGAIAGLAGGVGAFAEGQGWLASADAGKTVAAGSEGSNIAAMNQAAAPGVESTPAMNNPSAYQAGAETAGLPSATSNITAPSALANPTEQTSSLFDAPTPASPVEAFNAAKDSQQANIGIGAGAIDGYRNAASVTGKSGSILDTLKNFTDIFKDKDGKYDKGLLSIASNFVGGMFDSEKAAKADYYQSQADLTKSKLANGSAIPNMNFSTSTGSIWKPVSPTYNAPRPSLFYAR
jgi:hypothetical protein